MHLQVGNQVGVARRAASFTTVCGRVVGIAAVATGGKLDCPYIGISQGRKGSSRGFENSCCTIISTTVSYVSVIAVLSDEAYTGSI